MLKKPLILAMFAAHTYSQSAYALTEQATTSFKLDQVVVTATKTERPIDKVTASVDVITQDDIDKMGATTLKEVFEKTPGLTLQYGTFSSGVSAAKGSVNIRGNGVTGTLWLLDGRRLAGEAKNPYDMDRIPASMIERIEVVKGPMSALYGADAVGGVINIITKQPQDGFQSNLSLTSGSNSEGKGGNTQFSLSTRGAVGQFRGSFYVSSNLTQPYSETESTSTKVPLNGNKVAPSSHPKKTPLGLVNIADSYDVDVTYREDTQVNTVGGRGEFDVTDSLILGVDFNWFEEDREGVFRGVFHPTAYKNPQNQKNIPAYDVPVTSKDENTRLDLGVDALYDLNDDLDIKLRVYQSDYDKVNTTTLNQHADFGYASADDSASNGMTGNATINSYELSSNWQANDDHLVTTGVEYRTVNRKSTIFSQTSDLETREFAHSAIYLQDDFVVNDKLSFTLGGRYDQFERLGYTDAFNVKHQTRTDAESTFKLGGLYQLSNMAKVRINLAQGFRVPDLGESYIQKQTPAGMQLGAYTIDNRFGKVSNELKAERATTYELSLGGRNAKLGYSLTLFHNDIRDKIAEVKVIGKDPQGGNAPYTTFQNLNDVNTQGAEFTFDYQLSKALELEVFWTELTTENKETGKALEFNPQRLISANLNWQITKGLNTSVMMTNTGKQRYLTDSAAEAYTSDYTLTNISVGYAPQEKQKWKVIGGINNVFAEKVDKVLGSNVGTYYYAGVRVNF